MKIKLTKCQNPSLNAVYAMRQGKYFACQIAPVDNAENRIPKNTKVGREVWAKFEEDIKAAVVKSDDPRAVGGMEWHHIDRSSTGYMVWVSVLVERGWQIAGTPNKELVY